MYHLKELNHKTGRNGKMQQTNKNINNKKEILIQYHQRFATFVFIIYLEDFGSKQWYGLHYFTRLLDNIFILCKPSIAHYDDCLY